MSASVIPTNTAQFRLILQGFNMHQDIKEYRAGNSCAAYSLGASRAEQRGDYAEAEKLWRKAAQSPCSTLRRIWAEHRAQFCANAHQKGWKPIHERETL